MSDVEIAARLRAMEIDIAVDLMGLTGYYQLVSMLLNADRYPLPDGAQPELKPLAAK